MIVYNKYNQISYYQWNVRNCTWVWGIFEDYSVESNIRNKSDVNKTADQYIVWNNSTREYFRYYSV